MKFEKPKSSGLGRSGFDASRYVEDIKASIPWGYQPNEGRKAVVPSAIDLSAPDTWPVVMQLAEVAQVLRYGDEGTVRDLTNLPADEGGLRYVSLGTGHKRRRRVVLKVDLLEFLSRNSISPTRTDIPKRTARKPVEKLSTGGLMARSARKTPRN